MINLTIVVFTIFLLSTVVNADDFGQSVSGQTLEQSEFSKVLKRGEAGESFAVPGSVKRKKDKYSKSKDESYAIPGSVADLKFKDKYLRKTGYSPLGTHENVENYMESDSDLIRSDIGDQGKKTFGIIYIKDMYEYKGMGGLFNKIFRNGKHSHNAGTIHLNFDRYITRGRLDLSWGMNVGFGFSTGNGYFDASGTESDTTFNLASFPMDLSLKGGVNLGSWLKLNLSGGPTVMGLYQTRNDRDSGEKGKRRRQIGYGYFVNSSLQFNLSNLFKRDSVDMYNSESITNYYVDLAARIQSYSHFQDDFTIEGSSFGLGFTFEYF